MLDVLLRSENRWQIATELAIVLLCSYCIIKPIYNVYFHPLSHVPGPRLAAMGSLYEFWYDVVKDGTYLWKIEEMHEKYGKYTSFLISKRRQSFS